MMLRGRKRSAEGGFSLIELMVVVLIIGILLAIAVPTFLSAQSSAKRRAATANVREALSAGRVVFADIGTFDSAAPRPFDQSALRAAEPSFLWTGEAGDSTAPNEISWKSVSSTEVHYAARSKGGDCFLIRDRVSGGAGGGTTYGKNVDAATCRAGDPTTYEPSSVAAGW